MTLRRPVLRYHGGKWKLAPWIISHFPPHSVYVEPFGGAASVLLQKPRTYGEVYNDLDGEVVNVFRVLQSPKKAAKLRRRLHLTPFAREEFERAYRFSADPVERAARLIIRSFQGFGSDTATREHLTGFRVAVSRDGFMGTRIKDRGGQTPAVDWEKYSEQVPAFVDRLRGVVLERRPAIKIIDTFDKPEVLFYLDPPYVPNTRPRIGRGRGYRHEMTDADHEALAERLQALKGHCVISGYRCALYDRLFRNWERRERHHLAQEARKSIEVLWLNPACAAAQRQQVLQYEASA